jgi:GNAT superfamily N-acetyltransferase
MTMNHFTKIPFTFDPADALEELADNDDLWHQITARQDFPGSDHKDTQTIYLRGPGHMETAADYMKVGNAVTYEGNVWQLPVCAALMRRAMEAIGADELGYVMVVKLRSGGTVTPHVDEGPYSDHFTRFHLVLSTNENCLFCAGMEQQHMPAGELWQFDHKARHMFSNLGRSDRIHIIFDAVPAPSLKVCITGRGADKLPGMFEVRRSSVDEMLGNSQALFTQHWDEIARNKDVMVLKPDESAYRRMEEAGSLLILAAFKAGQIVGYSVNFIIRHPHYADLLVCQNDLLFIDQAHREGGAGIRLMRRTEQEGKKRGCRLMLWHAKEGTPLAAMLPRMGYGVQDIVYSKQIE